MAGSSPPLLSVTYKGSISAQQIAIYHCGLSAHYGFQHLAEFLTNKAGRQGVPRGAVSILNFVVVCFQLLTFLSALFCVLSSQSPVLPAVLI